MACSGLLYYVITYYNISAHTFIFPCPGNNFSVGREKSKWGVPLRMGTVRIAFFMKIGKNIKA